MVVRVDTEHGERFARYVGIGDTTGLDDGADLVTLLEGMNRW